MWRGYIAKTISEGLLTALDDCLNAMLSGEPSIAGEERAYSEVSRELAPLLAVARELMRSRERIDEQLTPWRDGLLIMEYVSDPPGEAIASAGRWPGLN